MLLLNNMENIKWYCPICGLDLTNQTHGVTKNDTVKDTFLVLNGEICPCCGTQFGIGDGLGEDLDYIFYSKYRKEWIKNGMKWKHEDQFSLNSQPPNWSPIEQLKNIPEDFLDNETRDIIKRGKA